MLAGKKILIGVTGSIAIYKSCSLVRLFVRNQAEVKVVITENATRLISPLTFQALSHSPVYVSMFQPITTDGLEHISLSEWSDAFIIAPITANTIGKIAHGIADNLLTNVAISLSSGIPLVLAPAMNANMWNNSFVQNNINRLRDKENCFIINPEEGILTNGKEGKGRMAEPKTIFKFVERLL